MYYCANCFLSFGVYDFVTFPDNFAAMTLNKPPTLLMQTSREFDGGTQTYTHSHMTNID